MADGVDDEGCGGWEGCDVGWIAGDASDESEKRVWLAASVVPFSFVQAVV